MLGFYARQAGTRPIGIDGKPIMSTALILAEPDAARAALESDLKVVGVHVLGATTCEDLVQDVVRSAPDLVIVLAPTPVPELFTALAALQSARPVAVAVFTDDVRAESIEHALASGVHAWIVRGYGAERLRPTIHLARVRFQKERAQRRALQEMSVRLEERKLLDRAKGILMTTGGMAEEDAFRMLRDTAMHGKRRLGQVAQRLIDAARSAEAINRAGQLRMLSQRLVKLHLLALKDIEPASARALQHASIDRVAQNLATLAQWISRATFGDLLETVEGSWRDLETALRPDTPGDVQSLDAAAERLLEAADRLTIALETASPVEGMHIVNLAGRQRMFAQRVAKLALMRAIECNAAPRTWIEQAQAAQTGFRDAVAALRGSALTSERERTALDRADDVWDELCRSAENPTHPIGQFKIAQTSEELLELFDALTERYGNNLKVLVG